MARPESLRKFAMLLLGTLKSPKLWNRFVPAPGLVPPVMSYWVFPAGGVAERLTCVFRPDGVIGDAAWAWLRLRLNEGSTKEPRRRRTMMGREKVERAEEPTSFLMFNPPVASPIHVWVSGPNSRMDEAGGVRFHGSAPRHERLVGWRILGGYGANHKAGRGEMVVFRRRGGESAMSFSVDPRRHRLRISCQSRPIKPCHTQTKTAAPVLEPPSVMTLGVEFTLPASAAMPPGRSDRSLGAGGSSARERQQKTQGKAFRCLPRGRQ